MLQLGEQLCLAKRNRPRPLVFGMVIGSVRAVLLVSTTAIPANVERATSAKAAPPPPPRPWARKGESLVAPAKHSCSRAKHLCFASVCAANLPCVVWGKLDGERARFELARARVMGWQHQGSMILIRSAAMPPVDPTCCFRCACAHIVAFARPRAVSLRRRSATRLRKSGSGETIGG